MKIKNLFKKFHPAFIYTTLFCLILCVVSFFVFFSAKHQLHEALQTTQIALLKSLEPYQRVLQNARWPAQRYEYLLGGDQKNRDSNFSMIATQMLQLSFGFDYDYFLLRSIGGEVRIEIKRGGLSSTKSPIYITQEEDFRKTSEGFFVRPCDISGSQYLCLIDMPHERTFVKKEQRNYSVIAISIAEMFLKAKYANIHSSWLVPSPFLQIDFNDNIIPISGDSPKVILLTASKKIDQGFYVMGGYSAFQFLFRIGFYSLIIICLLVLLKAVINHNIKKRVQFKLSHALLNKKLEHYNQIQGLIKGVVHDIKSPLAALKTLTSVEKDHQKQTLMNHVIKRLQMIARDLEIKRKTVEEHDLSTLPLGLLLQIVQLEKTKEYETQIQLADELRKNECWIYGSYSEFFRMMSNLINNAVEASSDGAAIFLGYRILENQFVEISVRDQGKGIPPEHIPHIFDQGTSFDKKGGTGFGLFHCKSTVESMKGKVSIESRMNTGTTVKITLPMVKEPTWAVEELSLKGIARVLVIDDEIMYHELWKKKINSHIELLCYEHPSQVPLSLLERADTVTLLDNNFGAEYGLGLRFLEETSIANCIVVTAEWTLSDIQKAVEELGVKLCGKDYLDQLPVLA